MKLKYVHNYWEHNPKRRWIGEACGPALYPVRLWGTHESSQGKSTFNALAPEEASASPMGCSDLHLL